MRHNQEAALNSDVCPVCGGSGYELFRQRVDGYDIPPEFARPCTRCRIQRRLQKSAQDRNGKKIKLRWNTPTEVRRSLAKINNMVANCELPAKKQMQYSILLTWR